MNISLMKPKGFAPIVYTFFKSETKLSLQSHLHKLLKINILIIKIINRFDE
jgi:hypothetical protein